MRVAYVFVVTMPHGQQVRCDERQSYRMAHKDAVQWHKSRHWGPKEWVRTSVLRIKTTTKELKHWSNPEFKEG